MLESDILKVGRAFKCAYNKAAHDSDSDSESYVLCFYGCLGPVSVYVHSARVNSTAGAPTWMLYRDLRQVYFYRYFLFLHFFFSYFLFFLL